MTDHRPVAADGCTIDQIVSFFSYRGDKGAPD